MARFDLNNPGHIAQLISQIEGATNRERKREDWSNYKIYSGDQRDLVLDELKRLFPRSWASMRVSNININRKVVDKIAKAYKEPPTRLIDGVLNEKLEDIYRDGMFNRTFQTMDSIFNRHKHVLSWVINTPSMPTKFSLRALSPYTYDLVINPDTNEVETVILSYPDRTITNSVSNNLSDGVNQDIAESQHDSGPPSKRYAIWDANFNVNVNVKLDDGTATEVDYIFNPENPDNINPLGRLPFTWITTNWDIPEYPTPPSLPKDSILINVLNTDLLTASALQGFGQLVIKYPKGQRIKQLHSGFNIAIELPQSTNPDDPPTDAQYINPNPDLNGMKDVVFEYAAAILSDNGLEGASIVSQNQNFTSGFDRLLASASVTERRQENIELYKNTVEEDIFEIIKAYDRINQTKMFNDADQLSVMFKKPKILQSETEKLDIIERRQAIGLDEEFEKFLKDNPNMSEDEAKEKLERIKKEQQSKAQNFIRNIGNPNGQEQGKTTTV